MTMLVNKERLLALAGHEDIRVRKEAVRGLETYFPGEPHVLGRLLDIRRRYPDYWEITAAFKHFPPQKEDVAEVIRLASKFSGDMKKEDALSARFHLIKCLGSYPLEFLEPHAGVLKSEETLAALYEAVIEWEELRKKGSQWHWDELLQLCGAEWNKENEASNGRYGEFLVDCLVYDVEAAGDGRIKDWVLTAFKTLSEGEYNLEIYLVRLAGRLKLEAAVPYLFEILSEVEPMAIIFSELIRALGRIGSEEVVEEIKRLYPPASEDDRETYAAILEYIPHDYCEDALLGFMEDETGLTVRTSLAMALCDIFSLRGKDVVLEMVENCAYDPSQTDLFRQFLSVPAYHDIHLENLEELEAKNDRFGESERENDPMWKAAGKMHLRQMPGMELREDDDEGDEDPRPQLKTVTKKFPSKKRKKKRKK